MKECRNTSSSILASHNVNDIGVCVIYARQSFGQEQDDEWMRWLRHVVAFWQGIIWQRGRKTPTLKIFHIFFNCRLENLKS